MKITNLTLILAAALAFTACKGDKDSGDSGDSGTGGGDGATDGGSGDGGSTDVVESCDVGVGLCFEFTNQTGVEAWCTGIAETYASIGWTAGYAENGCDAAQEGVCSGATGGDYGSLVADVYYYSEYEYLDGREQACADANGTFAG